MKTISPTMPASWLEIRMEDLSPDVQEAIQKRAADQGTTPAAVLESTLLAAIREPATEIHRKESQPS